MNNNPTPFKWEADRDEASPEAPYRFAMHFTDADDLRAMVAWAIEKQDAAAEAAE